MDIPNRYLNIKEVAEITGLTTAVLRVWEDRYDWPNPIRRSNSYRAYSPELVQQILTVRDHLNLGFTIGDLVPGGIHSPLPDPDIDEEEIEACEPTTTTWCAEQLPQPANRDARQFRDAILQALAKREINKLTELLERGAYQLRWQDLNLAVLMPILLGLFEQNYAVEEVDQRELDLIQRTGVTAERHANRQTISGGPIGVRIVGDITDWLVPAIVLILRERGLLAEPDPEGEIELRVIDNDPAQLRILVDGTVELADLFDYETSLPWEPMEV